MRDLKLILILTGLLLSACKIPYDGMNVVADQASLPEDEGVHTKNSLEWWYFTAHLKDTLKDREFGIEYVVFHVNPSRIKGAWMIHSAISDPLNDKFYYDYLLVNKPKHQFEGLPLNFHWDKKRLKSSLSGQMGEYHIQSELKRKDFGFNLKTKQGKGLSMHDESGYENYGGYARAGYYSFPRMESEGKLYLESDTFRVSGEMWYDRQWNCSGVFDRKIGWDWFGIQLQEPKVDLMVYRLYHQKDGREVLGASIIKENGETVDISSDQIQLKATENWTSPHSKAEYPMHWQISIPDQDLELEVQAAFPDQELELNSNPFQPFFYWEGMSYVKGSYRGKATQGKAYIEMTNRFR